METAGAGLLVQCSWHLPVVLSVGLSGVGVLQAGTTKPQLKTGEGLAENPLGRRRRHCHGQGQEALPMAPPPLRAHSISEYRCFTEEETEAQREDRVLGSGLVPPQLLSLLLVAVTWGRGRGLFGVSHPPS